MSVPRTISELSTLPLTLPYSAPIINTVQTKHMTTATANLIAIASELQAAGKEVKVTVLRTAHGTRANRYADRIRGGSSRVRTGAGSRSVHQSTKATALGDVR